MLVELGPNKRQKQISTSHTPAKYTHQLDRLRLAMDAVATGFSFQVVERSKSNTIKLGAFECSICIEGQKHLIASKLALGKWPAPSRVVARTMRFLGFGDGNGIGDGNGGSSTAPLRVYVLVLSAYDGRCLGADPGGALSLGVANDETREAFYPFASPPSEHAEEGQGAAEGGDGGSMRGGVGFYFLVDLEPSSPYVFTAQLAGWTQVSTVGPVFIDRGGPAVVRIFMAQEAPLLIRATFADGVAPNVPLVLQGEIQLRFYARPLAYTVQTGADGTVVVRVPAGISLKLSHDCARFLPKSVNVEVPLNGGDGSDAISGQNDVEICLVQRAQNDEAFG